MSDGTDVVADWFTSLLEKKTYVTDQSKHVSI